MWTLFRLVEFSSLFVWLILEAKEQLLWKPTGSVRSCVTFFLQDGCDQSNREEKKHYIFVFEINRRIYLKRVVMNEVEMEQKVFAFLEFGETQKDTRLTDQRVDALPLPAFKA